LIGHLVQAPVNPSSSTGHPAGAPSQPPIGPAGSPPRRLRFAEDFRHLFVRGLAALLPTLITLSVIFWVWNFLWESLGRWVILVIRYAWYALQERNILEPVNSGYISRYWSDDLLRTRLLGVGLALVLVYIVGFFLGNLIGRTFWRLMEQFVMKIPVVRAIYPAVKQVTDFVLADRRAAFAYSRVVAVQPHEKGIWSIGLVTGKGLPALSTQTGQEMITVFVPSSPTAFSGYVLVVPRSGVVELPLTVEEAMRLLISGGVIMPSGSPQQISIAPAATSTAPLGLATPTAATDAPAPPAPQGSQSPPRMAARARV
jgi:uncharacterized membrane protein